MKFGVFYGQQLPQPWGPHSGLADRPDQADGNTHEHGGESPEPFAHGLVPEFHAREPAHQEWKRRVLTGEIELEEIDTQPFHGRFGPNAVQVAAE